jgi:hypothetical protein
MRARQKIDSICGPDESSRTRSAIVVLLLLDQGQRPREGRRPSSRFRPAPRTHPLL